MTRDFFPATKTEAIALEYVRSQSLSGKSPREILMIYEDAQSEIDNARKEIRQKKQSGNF